jgi:hypothetical protein
MCFVLDRPRFEHRRPGDQPSYLRAWLSSAHLSKCWARTLRLPVTLFQIRHSQTPYNLMLWRKVSKTLTSAGYEINPCWASRLLRLPTHVTYSYVYQKPILSYVLGILYHTILYLVHEVANRDTTLHNKTLNTNTYIVRYGPRKGTTNKELPRPPTRFRNLSANDGLGNSAVACHQCHGKLQWIYQE